MSIFLSDCDRILDEICPAWRKDVASGAADLDFSGKQTWDSVFHEYRDVSPRVASTTGLLLERHRGMVRKVVIACGPQFPYLGAIWPPSHILMAVTVTLDAQATPIPGQGYGTTADNLRGAIDKALRCTVSSAGLLNFVGNEAEIKAMLKGVKP